MAGDDTALYNALLLTLRDAAKVPGRKVVIVFSNGPDNASMVAPDDVRAVEAKTKASSDLRHLRRLEVNSKDLLIFERCVPSAGHPHRRQSLRWRAHVVEAGGGRSENIREDMINSYTVTYYPQPNPNEGFRKILVELVNDPGKKLRVQVRPGYRPSRVF